MGTTRGVAGRFGLAYHFDGTDGRVHVSSSPSLSQLTGGSISAWIRPGTVAMLNVGSIASLGTGNSDDNVLLHSSCGNIQIIYSRTLSGTTNATTGCNTLALNVWAHVATVNDGMGLVTTELELRQASRHVAAQLAVRDHLDGVGFGRLRSNAEAADEGHHAEEQQVRRERDRDHRRQAAVEASLGENRWRGEMSAREPRG